MKIEDFLFKIRRREGIFYSELKDILGAILRFNFPAPKIIFRPLYDILIFWRFFSHFVLEKMIYVPIFKSRCSKCGKGLSLPNGIPWVEGNIEILIADDVTIDHNTFVSGSVHREPFLSIGSHTYLAYDVTISVGDSIQIGNDCLISSKCFIADNNGHPVEPQRRVRKEPVNEKDISPVIIEDNVWIGTGAVILRGVTIGTGSVIAANSVVTESVPPNCIAMGVPAQIVKSGIDAI